MQQTHSSESTPAPVPVIVDAPADWLQEMFAAIKCMDVKRVTRLLAENESYDIYFPFMRAHVTKCLEIIMLFVDDPRFMRTEFPDAMLMGLVKFGDADYVRAFLANPLLRLSEDILSNSLFIAARCKDREVVKALSEDKRFPLTIEAFRKVLSARTNVLAQELSLC